MVAPATELGISLSVFAAIPDDSAAQVCDFALGDYKNSEQEIGRASCRERV